VAYTISAPAGTRVTIGTVSGGITVTDIKGEITANAISGAVRIANAGRIASVRSVSGDVEIIDTQTDGGIEVQSVSGSVVVRNVTAHRMDLGSVSGGVVIHDVKCERIGAHTISGSVDFAGALTRNGRYELSSHSGDVRLAVAGDTGFEVQAASFSGSVRSDVPITIQGNDLAGGRGRRHSMRGVFGDGSAVLDLRTFSGSIAISKR
jgi:DUF4097 and DUF4098 domain-containing protein YvlB